MTGRPAADKIGNQIQIQVDEHDKLNNGQPEDQRSLQEGGSGGAKPEAAEDNQDASSIASTVRKGLIVDAGGNLIQAGKRIIGRITTPRKIKKNKPSVDTSINEFFGEEMAQEMADYDIQLLSTIHRMKGLNISSDTIRRYTEYANGIDLASAPPEQIAFVQDYLSTMSVIQKEKEARPKGLEIDQSLYSLPKTMSAGYTIKLNELVIRPVVFDGESPRPRRWIQRYSEAVIANEWTDFIAIKYFPTFLDKSAKDWFFIDIKPQLRPDTKFMDLHKAFVDTYVGENDDEELARIVENTRQRQNETVSVFIPRLRRLMLLLTPDMAEAEQMRQIKNKLRPEYKQWVSYGEPSNLIELRDICMKVEKGLKNSSFRERSNNERTSPAPRRGSNSNYRRNSPGRFISPRRNVRFQTRPIIRRSTFPDHRGPNPRETDPPNSRRFESKQDGIKCYNCGKIGHYSKDCWSKREASKNNGRNYSRYNENKRVNFVDETEENLLDLEGEYDEDQQETQTEVLTVTDVARKGKQVVKPRYTVHEIPQFNINLVVGGGKMIKQKVICNDIEIEAVVDTGAYVSVIDEGIIRKFPWKLEPVKINLVGADGSNLEVLGLIKMDVQMVIKNVMKQRRHPIIVVRGLSSPMLLGLELMKELGICVDTANAELRFSDQKFKSGIRTPRKELIPARSQTVLQAEVATIGNIMVLPFCLENGLVVANEVACVKNNTVPIVVLNPLPVDSELEAGTQLGGFEPFEAESGPRTSNEATTINQVISAAGFKESIRVGDNLTPEQLGQLTKLLTEHQKAFSLNGEIGMTNIVKHKIELLPNSEPFAEPLRRRALVQIEETRRQVNELLKEDIIEESSSPWASAYVLAKKKNGEMRLCIDFRKLNLVTKKLVYPLPNIEECLETLSGKKFFTQLDFKSGFWQIEMDEGSKEMTAFRTEDGLFQFKRMPFGLTNAPATFQRMVNSVLAGLKGMNLQVFIDDICIATRTWPEHLDMLRSTLKLVIKANLKIKADKCVFGAESIKFLGHEISSHGIRQDPEKLKALLKLPRPADAKGVKRALGMFSYYRKFVNKFAMIVEPLTKLTRKGVEFVWAEEQQKAYEQILEELGKNATLAHFNHSDPIMLKTDASRTGIAGMLLQRHKDEWKLVTCCSRRLTSSEANYGITDLEGLGLIYTVTKLRPYLLGKHFKVLVDHCALCVLNKRQPTSQRLCRWAIILSEFDFEIVYTKGNQHCDIDCLSRAPVDDPTDHYLDEKVYQVRVLNPAEWKRNYADEESRRIFMRALDKQEGLKINPDGLIYNNNLLYVPKAKRHEIVSRTHEIAINAHPGVTATLAKLKELYWWPNMQEDVKRVLSQCKVCRTQKIDRQGLSGQMHSHQVFGPGERVAIDLIERVTESLNGNSYIIVAIDMFTRFVDAKAVAEKGAPTFTEYFVEYAGRYGVPHEILTDHTSTICNTFTGQMMKAFGVDHVKATPYHSQGNAIVERVNQTIQEKIRVVLENPLHEKSWDSVLPVVVLAINCSYHSSLGCTPYEMTFGKKPPLQEKGLVYKASPTDLHAQLVQRYLKECYVNAIAIQSTSQERSKQFYDSKRRQDLFKVGDNVYIKTRDRSSKFYPKFQGPYKVVKQKDDIYTLEEQKTKRIITRHVNDIRHGPAEESSRDDCHDDHLKRDSQDNDDNGIAETGP